MRSILTLADDPIRGGLAMVVSFDNPMNAGKFSAMSDAHQHMAILVKIMDRIAERREELGESVVSVENLDSSIIEAMKYVENDVSHVVDELTLLSGVRPAETSKIIISNENGQIQ